MEKGKMLYQKIKDINKKKNRKITLTGKKKSDRFKTVL